MLALLVEDDSDVAEVLAHHVTRLGFQASIAPSGEDAETLLGQKSWDLVVVDILLPGIDGRELLRRIRARPDGRHPAIVVTSILGQYELDKVDADARLPKPFRSADVTRAVNEAIAAARGRSPDTIEEG